MGIEHKQIFNVSRIIMNEKYSFQRNDFQENIISSFRELRNKTNFQDVTLVSDDQVQISAHKVVLAVCSGFFENILSKNTHSHPFLCLDGINSKDLHNVLDYVYNGEVQVKQDYLERFIQIAKKLQLQGLLRRQENQIENERPLEKSNLELSKPEPVDSTFYNDGMNDTVPENKAEKTFEMVANTDLFGTSFVKPISINSEQTQGTATVGLDEHIQKQIVKVQGGHQCLICGKFSRNISHLKEHIETHIDGLIFPCNFCESVSRSRKGSRLHMLRCRNKPLSTPLEITMEEKSY